MEEAAIMKKNKFNPEKRINEIKKQLEKGLKELYTDQDWFTKYNIWKAEEMHQYDSLLIIEDPLSLSNVGNRDFFDMSDKISITNLEIIKICSFISEEMLNYERHIVSLVSNERNKAAKANIIRKYFKFVEKFIHNQNLSSCIVMLNDFAEEQTVLYPGKPIDLYKSFYSLRELLRKTSIESIYLLFTQWRISKEQNVLKILMSSITQYIRAYYYSYNHDPSLKLFENIDDKALNYQLLTVGKWLDIVSMHTDAIFEKYQDLNWLYPMDRMVDKLITTNQISKYDRYIYKRFFRDDDNDTVLKKATCNHSYGIWIKTADLIVILCEIFRIIKNDTLLSNKLEISPNSAMQLYENMIEVRDFFISKIFKHRTYYESNREYLDSRINEILEEDEETFSEYADIVNKMLKALSTDSIDDLLMAKQKYIQKSSSHMTDEQKEQFEEYIQTVVKNINDRIQKLNIYQELFQSITSEFKEYAVYLMGIPNIFCSLVSAEYLFNQYVQNAQSNENFDYSCISIMYYMSLEDFVNKLIYTPFSKDILINIEKKDWRQYVSHSNSFWDNKNKTYKSSCEIGNLGFLLTSIDEEMHFKNYLINRYPKIDIERIKQFGEKLKDIAPRRNKAAHGSDRITYEEVKNDRSNVFIMEINQYRGLILEMLELLF